MRIVNMHEAKTHLSKLVEDALSGEEIILAKAGKPLVRLVPYEGRPKPRTPGRLKGRIRIAPDFDETPEEILSAFEGGE
ncbi:MAG TPA: type II toxin-antitoxin system prevent-host-death family antitoxin [Deltaproteobacteria bacterium]|nr:type II toxin-antitoxin system prevent-host-death family antitoxin [Deltaproteobacteria bacterium]